jgi:hypothetical protein
MNYYKVTAMLPDNHTVTHNFLSKEDARALADTYETVTPAYFVAYSKMTESEIVNG